MSRNSILAETHNSSKLSDGRVWLHGHSKLSIIRVRKCYPFIRAHRSHQPM